MAGEKRKDAKGRILKDCEDQMVDGHYRYRYKNANGNCHSLYPMDAM